MRLSPQCCVVADHKFWVRIRPIYIAEKIKLIEFHDKEGPRVLVGIDLMIQDDASKLLSSHEG